MAALSWTREAQSWLETIYKHIALDNPGAAANTVQAIVRKAELLQDHPRLGYRLEHQDVDARVLLHKDYRIVDRVESEHRIGVLGVFHGALELNRYLD